MRSAEHPRAKDADRVAAIRYRRGFAALLAGACGAVRGLARPVATAIAHLRATSDATHDEDAIRVLGVGSTGIWREFDALIGMPALAFSFSTNVMRAQIVSALGCGLAAFLLYTATRGLLEQCAKTDRLGIFVAAIATWTATLGAAWQTEACSVGGATWSAAFPFLALAILGGISAENACTLHLSRSRHLRAAWRSRASRWSRRNPGRGARVLFLGKIKPSTRDAISSAAFLAIGAGGPIAFALWRRVASVYEIPAPSFRAECSARSTFPRRKIF